MTTTDDEPTAMQDDVVATSQDVTMPRVREIAAGARARRLAAQDRNRRLADQQARIRHLADTIRLRHEALARRDGAGHDGESSSTEEPRSGNTRPTLPER